MTDRLLRVSSRTCLTDVERCWTGSRETTMCASDSSSSCQYYPTTHRLLLLLLLLLGLSGRRDNRDATTVRRRAPVVASLCPLACNKPNHYLTFVVADRTPLQLFGSGLDQELDGAFHQQWQPDPSTGCTGPG